MMISILAKIGIGIKFETFVVENLVSRVAWQTPFCFGIDRGKNSTTQREPKRIERC